MFLRQLALVAVFVVSPAAIAGPPDDLLRLVPEDYTFCVVVQNLRNHARPDGDSSFLKGISDSPLIKWLQTAPEAVKFQHSVETILKELGVTPDQFRDDLFGDALVFAYRKGPPGQDGKEDGLILLHARNEDLLRRVVDRIIEVQTKGGEIKRVEPIGEANGRYFRRVKALDAEPADFFAVQGHRLAFSGNESLLKGLLPRLTAEGTGEAPLARRMKQLGVDKVPVSMLINPRSFDADVLGSAQAGKGSEQAFLKEFASYWKAVDGLVFFLNFRPSIEVGLAMNVRKAEIPKAAARFLTEAAKRSPLWDRMPEDALFAVCGRVHLESLAGMLGAFLAEPDRKKVLESIADASRPFVEAEDHGFLARGFGPDVGFWVTAPESSAKTWCPHAVLAVKVGDGPEGRQAERVALKGLDVLSRIACFQNKEMRVGTEMQGSVEVQFLKHASAFPPGFQPSFASKGGYIILADSPGTVSRFEPPNRPATDADEVPVLRVSASAWRKYLADHRGPLLDYLAKLQGANPKEFGQHLNVLLPMLEGLDRLELVQRTGPDRVTLLMRFREVKK
jgi:hypothetical protein